MKNFDFVNDPLLRGRIERVWDDIAALGGLLGEQNKPEVKSCLRKTMLVKRHTSRFTPLPCINYRSTATLEIEKRDRIRQGGLEQ